MADMTHEKSAAPGDPPRKRMMPIYAGLPTELGGGAPAESDAELFGPAEAGVLGGLTGTANGDPAGRLAGLLKGVSAGTGAYLGGKALMPEDGEMDWGTVGGAAGGGAAGYVASSALLSLLRGGEPYGPGVLGRHKRAGDEVAQANPALASLLMAKQHSDNMRYAQKHAILRDLIRTDPSSFMVDSDNGFAVGLTHSPTGFRIHMPAHMLPPELPRPEPKLAALSRLLELAGAA